MFKLGYELKRNQDVWEQQRDWKRNASLDEEWPGNDVEYVDLAFSRCPWLAGLPGLQRGAESATHGFGRLLSNQWLTDTALACMLDVVRSDYHQRKDYRSSTYICDPSLGQAITKGPNGPTTKFYGRKVQDGSMQLLMFPMNINNMHWIAVKVDIPGYTIAFGDSYPAVTRPHVKQVIANVKRWLCHWIPGSASKWLVNETG